MAVDCCNKVIVRYRPPNKVNVYNYPPYGQSGGGIDYSTYNTTSGEALSGGRVVVIKNNQAFYFNPNDITMLGLVTGVTKTAASLNASVAIKLFGAFYESGLGLTPNEMYFVGVNGTLITDPTGLLIVQSIGNSLNEDTLNININSPIVTI
jgi:hypothetical protein